MSNIKLIYINPCDIDTVHDAEFIRALEEQRDTFRQLWLEEVRGGEEGICIGCNIE